MLIKTLILLTSINLTSLSHVPSVLKEHYRTHHQRIEKVFRESFEDSGYKLEVIHYAGQDELWRTLKNPNVAGVFWVSHAGSAAAFNPYITSFSSIADQYGYDIAPTFQGINENIGFLGLVGCSSQKVLAQKKFSLQRADDNPLKIVSFEKEVDAREGLKEAISEFKKFDKKTQLLSKAKICEKSSVYPIRVERKISDTEQNLRHPPVRIETASGKVLGTFPKAFPGDRQATTVYLDLSASTEDFNFYVNAGNNNNLRDDDIALGEFEFKAGWTGNSNWNVLQNPSGKPMGITRYYYAFEGSFPSQSQSVFNDSCSN